MENYRGTYVKVNLSNIRENVEKLVKKYNDYDYYFGVVKADSYSHYDIRVIKNIIAGGCNYLAVSSLEEALTIREEIKDIPILCLGVIHPNYLSICRREKITITIPSLEYFETILPTNLEGISMHLKIDTGMNRLGIKTREEMNHIWQKIKERGLHLEGIYTHIYKASDGKTTKKQLETFQSITKEIDLSKIPIVHIAQSETLTRYPHIPHTNGCRLGLIMYGFSENSFLQLKPTFSLHSRVIALKDLKKGESVGYDATYKAKEEEKIAIVAIGYADGVIRANKGRMVYINGIPYPIVGNICMDMLMVKVDRKVKLYDTVDILKDNYHIRQVAEHLKTIPYEVICTVGKRVPRIYIEENEKQK